MNLRAPVPGPRPVAQISTVFLAAAIGFLPLFLMPSSRVLADVSTLNQQKTQLQQQAEKDKAAAAQQKTLAQRAADRLASATSQITQLQGSIQSTQAQIADVQVQIEGKNQENDKLASELRGELDQQGSVLRQYYIELVSQPDTLTMFSNQSYSKREESSQQLTALRNAVTALAVKTQEKQVVVTRARDELTQKQKDLEGLKDQQTEQQRGLADVKQQQADLKSNAESAEQSLEDKAAKEEASANKIEDQISAELAALVAAKAKGQPINGGQNTGNRVARGTVVGHEGSTGNSTGPHVHFECRVNNVAVNCLPYVSSGTLVYPMKSFIISQNFGEMANSSMYHGSPHSGTDLAGPYGQAVAAPSDGTVILNKWYGDYGNAWAEQLDNGMVILLGHMTGN